MDRVEPKAASKRPGMGATLYGSGVSFRVWAPHADRVFVTGEFNDWSETSLFDEGNGFWSVDVEQAKADQEYKYIIRNGEETLIKNDPYARLLTHSAGNSVIFDTAYDWEYDIFHAPSWNEMIIYEMHVGSFTRGKNDAPGDFHGAIERIPHLKELGINTIKVMPPSEFSGPFSMGYNPSHIFSVEVDYGGARAFKDFIKAAHKSGIAVIIDVVYNHFGPGDLDLWQFDGWQQNDMGGIYFFNDWRAETPWGSTRPDYTRQEVRSYIRNNVMMWLEEFHLDGIRWDATAYIRNVKGNNHDDNDLPEGWSLLQWINDEIKSKQPWAISIAEDLKDSDVILKSTAEGGAGFDAQWDGASVYRIRETLLTPDDSSRDMEAVRNVLEKRYGSDVFSRVIYYQSHDEVNQHGRLIESIDADNPESFFALKRASLASVLLLSSPGVPMFFQGDEFLDISGLKEGVFLDWSLANSHAGFVRLFSDLIHLRKNASGLSAGLTGQGLNVFHVNRKEKIIAFHRWKEGGHRDDTVVVMNFSVKDVKDYRLGLPKKGLWKVRFNSDSKGYCESFHDTAVFDFEATEEERDGLPFSGTVSLGPYSAVILSLDD